MDRIESVTGVPVIMSTAEESHAILIVRTKGDLYAVYGEDDVRQMSDAVAEIKATIPAFFPAE